MTSEEIGRPTDEVHAQLQLNSTDLYNAMIYPFTRMVIKGAIWYQGMLLRLKKKYHLLLFQAKVILFTIVINTIVHLRK